MSSYSNKRGFAAILIVVVVLVLGLAGVGYWMYMGQGQKVETSTADLQPTGQTMKIAKYYWPGTFWVEIAQEKGWFEEEGLKVELIDTNSDYFASLQQTVDGEIDANNFPLYDLLSYVIGEEKMITVIAGDVSKGAAGIVSIPDVQTIDDLQGKRVGLAASTFSEYMLEYVLKTNNVNISDVELVEVNTEETIDLLRNGTVDAVVSWEPLMSEAVALLGANIIFETSQAFGLDSSVWALRKDVVDSRPGDVQAFVNVWARTTDYISSNEDEAFGIIANIYGVTLEDVKGYAALDQILTSDEARDRFDYSTGIDSIHGLLIGMNEFMIDQGITDSLVRTDTIINDDFINAVE